MSLLDRLLGRKVKASSTDKDGWFYNWATQDAGAEGPGRGVSPERARALTAVWACVGIIAEDLAKLPVGVYRRQGERRIELPDHPVSMLLGRPNGLHTGFEWRETMQGSVGLRGNGYSYIERDRRGVPVALWPMDPRNVTVLRSRDGRELFYRCADVSPDPLPADVVLHVRWRSADGYTGMSPVREAREALGVALSAQGFAHEAFENSAQPKGAVEVPTILTPEAVALLRDSWERQHKGRENANKIAILHGGMTWKQVGLSADDMQFIEQRKFSVAEIARIWRVPPHMIGDLEKATFSNIEQQAIEYVGNVLQPWATRWEQRLAESLLSDADRASGVYIRFNLAGVLRGDLKSRYDAYAVGRNWGWLSPNDVRKLEDMDPIAPDDGGDDYLRPTNMAKPGDPPKAAPGGAAEPAPDPAPAA